MDILSQIASRIIKEQELIIGPLAWNDARKVSGLLVSNTATGEVVLEGDKKQAIDNLICKIP